MCNGLSEQSSSAIISTIVTVVGIISTSTKLPRNGTCLIAGARAFVCSSLSFFLLGRGAESGRRWGENFLCFPSSLTHSLTHSETHTHRQSVGSASCKSASPHSSRERGDGRDGKEKINQAKRACCCLWSQPLLSPARPPLLPCNSAISSSRLL